MDPLRYFSLTLLFVSGFCALVYEVVWTRMLIPVFGNTVFAISTVLAVFMAGLAIGSYVAGRYVDSSGGKQDEGIKALNLYAFVELGIGIYALAFPLLLSYATPLYLSLARTSDSGYLTDSLIRFFICFLLLLPPSILIGATFPLFGKYYIDRKVQIGQDVALIYGINTAGGVFGALAAGFFMVRFWGALKTVHLAAAGNVLIAVLALLICYKGRAVKENRDRKYTKIERERKGKKKSGAVAENQEPLFNRVFFTILTAIGLAGFCALAYEVLWTRILVLLIQNSVYSFSIILGGFLLGIAIGALLLYPALCRIKDQITVFGLMQILVGISCLLTPLFFMVPERPGTISYLSFLLTYPLLPVMIPVILMGASIPMAAGIFRNLFLPLGRNLGTLYSVNTFGCLLGSVLCGFWLIPAYGCRNSMLILFGINLLAGFSVLIIRFPGLLVKSTFAIAGLALFVAGQFILPGDVISRHYAAIEKESELLYYNEGLTANASIIKTVKGLKILYLNGMSEVINDRSALRTFRMMGFVPFVLHPDPANALVITFGAGITAGMAVNMVNDMECVELNEKCTEIAKFFKHENHDVIRNERMKLQFNDGRNYLLMTPKKYSVIISDATHPHSYDSWILFTREFYQLCRNRLDANGVLCQWLPFHGLDPVQYRTIINTFNQVFPHLSIWSIDHAYSLLIGTINPLEIDPSRLAHEINRKKLRPFLEPLGMNNPNYILGCFIMGENNVQKLLSGSMEFNTDNLPYNQFFPLMTTGNQRLRWHVKNHNMIYEFKEDVQHYFKQ